MQAKRAITRTKKNGEQLGAIMTALGLTDEDVAAYCNTDRSAVNRWKNAKATPRGEKKKQLLAKKLGCKNWTRET